MKETSYENELGSLSSLLNEATVRYLMSRNVDKKQYLAF